MALSGDANPAEFQLASQLKLLPGDLVFSEIPYVDARDDDFTHFHNLTPTHLCVWVNGESLKGFARSHYESYQSPGLTLTGLWPGRHVVFRYIADALISNRLAGIMHNWAFTHLHDLEQAMQAAEAHPYLSVANDLLALAKNQSLSSLGAEGIRRAILFAARRDVKGEPEPDSEQNGQRCTAIVTAAFQASVLAAVVKPYDPAVAQRLNNSSLLLDYADIMMEKKWRKHPLGERLLKATANNDYSAIFPEPFAIDQRYATPKNIYEKLKKAQEFSLIGHFSYFNDKLISIEKA